MSFNIDWDLILKYLNGECSEAEKEKIHNWKNNDKQLQEYLDDIESIWKVEPDWEIDVDVQRAWLQMQARLFSEKDQKSAHASHKASKHNISNLHATNSASTVFYKVAAVLVMGIMLGIGYFLYEDGTRHTDEQTVSMQTIATDKGEKANITFSDGTKMVLNSASEARFPQQFGSDKRKIELEGEAYFNVARNESSPFVVETRRTRVKVLGTKFNVRDWKGDAEADVVVNRGKVSVETADSVMGYDKVILKKNQQSILSEGQESIKVKDADSRKFMLWLERGMYFDNDSFKNVLRNLERRYAVSFRVEDKTLLDVNYTGEFRDVDLDKVLKVLSATIGVEFHKNKEVITVRKSDKNMSSLNQQ